MSRSRSTQDNNEFFDYLVESNAKNITSYDDIKNKNFYFVKDIIFDNIARATKVEDGRIVLEVLFKKNARPVSGPYSIYNDWAPVNNERKLYEDDITDMLNNGDEIKEIPNPVKKMFDLDDLDTSQRESKPSVYNVMKNIKSEIKNRKNTALLTLSYRHTHSKRSKSPKRSKSKSPKSPLPTDIIKKIFSHYDPKKLGGKSSRKRYTRRR
jgi:hypothetical protein